MSVPTFEEVLTFIFETVRNRKSAKTTVNKLTELLLTKHGLKEITFCSIWDRYYLTRTGESLDVIDKKYLGKPFRNGQNFYSSLIQFACEILRVNGLIIGYSNNGLGNYEFLGNDFDGKISLSLLKKHISYEKNIKFLIISIIRDCYESAANLDSEYKYQNAVKDVSYTIQSFNKRIYDNKDPFLCQLEKDLLATLDQMFNGSNVSDEKLSGLEKTKFLNTINEQRLKIESQNNLDLENENLKQQIQSLTLEINQLKEITTQSLVSQEKPNLEETLLQKLKQLHPTAFEKFSLQLIKSVALARGGEVDIFHNGQVGDGGVDGVIEAPKTFGKGKEKVFVQCKRYDKTSIGRPELQAFAGAMLTEDITVGIFITTSTFSKQAINYVDELENKGKSIELFDGQRIVKHMLRNKIGVVEQVTSSFELDESYFNKFNQN